MASTIPAINAFDYAKRNLKNMPLEQVMVRLLDTVSKILWMAGPFRWTVGTLSPITLISATSDYTLAPPADFLYLIDAYIADGANTPRHLEIMPTIPSNIVVTGLPQFISYQGSNTFRISPIPGTLVTPTKYVIGTYKKTAPELTASNVYTSTTLQLSDEWYHVYEAGVLWQAYLWGDDQRAGTANVDGSGKMAFTGQRATFEAGIAQMLQREPMPIFDARVARDQKDVTA